jgi:hypothetical protein
MKNLSDELCNLIFKKIYIKESLLYVPFGDGEQTLTFFYKDYYPFNSVNKKWHSIFNNKFFSKL